MASGGTTVGGGATTRAAAVRTGSAGRTGWGGGSKLMRASSWAEPASINSTIATRRVIAVPPLHWAGPDDGTGGAWLVHRPPVNWG